LRACTPAERAEAIEQLGALLCATQAELCDVVTAADAEGDWKVAAGRSRATPTTSSPSPAPSDER
jgi:hypothetical protein